METKSLIAAAALLVTTTLPTFAAEYFVTRQGQDTNPGTSKTTAFRTVQKGVDALQPGDTLTIGRGEYFEGVKRDGIGSMDAQTTIRAEIPGTVTLRGDVALPSSAFKKVDGYRFVYVADFDRDVQAINEVDTLTQMPIFPVIGELDFVAGTSSYDAENKKLYISTSDYQPPSAHHYTVSVLRETGLMLLNPRRVTVDGIAATGFQSRTIMPNNPNHWTNWGIMLNGARGCVISNCVAYFNGSGLVIASNANSADGVENGWNLIEKSVAYANGSNFAPEAGNIMIFNSNHDEIRDVYAYRGAPNGVRHYGLGIRGPGLLKNSISWGNAVADYFLKGGEIDKYGMAENSIALGKFHAKNIRNSIVGSTNQYARMTADNVGAIYSEFVDPELARTRRDEAFADPENLDFRLQATSSLRGSAPDGTDSGAFPYQPNVFYLTTSGKDSNDGLSTKNSWKTLAHAMKKLRAGDTLYLEGGTYNAAGELKIANAEGQSTSIRARGNSTVLIRGDIAISGSRGLEFERLNFSGAITLANSRDVRFNNCRFSHQSTPLLATNVQNLKVTHSEFTGFNQAAVQLDKSTLVWLSSNIFDNKTAPAVQTDAANAVLYSDYNSYANVDNAWRVGGANLKLAELQKAQDEYSVARTPEYSLENGAPKLQNAAAFKAGGRFGTGLGFYREFRETPMVITAPIVHSTSDRTADIEWFTSAPAVTEIAWGETPDTPNKANLNKGVVTITDGYNSFSLNGLKPNTKYFFRIVSSQPLESGVGLYTTPATPKEALISFQTAAAAAAPRVLHVAPDGDDKNNGLTRTAAWKTVAHAADAARAGDTILIGGGTYQETVRVRASGSPGKPIRFKAAPGEKVIFDGNDRLIKTAFSLAGKQHIKLDGLYFQKFGDAAWRTVVDLVQCDNVQITRCFFNAFGAGVPGAQLRFSHCTNITFENNVVSRGMHGISVPGGGNNISIKNNAFINNLINPVRGSGGAPKSYVVTNNIIVDSIPSKAGVFLFEFGGFDRYVFENNALYLRVSDEQRKPFFFFGDTPHPGRMTLADYEKHTGYKNLVVADPQFAISQGQEPVDRTGKKIEFLGDWYPRADLDFDDLFTTNPELKARKIGLIPEAFADFHFYKK